MNSILENRKTGFFKAKIIAVCPDANQLEEILGEVPEEHPSYFYSVRGVKTAKLDFYLENINGENEIFRYRIYVQDEDDTFRTGASRWINDNGEWQITDSEDKLFDSFTKEREVLSWMLPNGEISEKYNFGATPSSFKVLSLREYRIAKKGEYNLFHLQKMAGEFNGLLDIDSILDGDLSSLKIKMNEPAFVAFAYVDRHELKQEIHKEFIELRYFNDFIENNSKAGVFKKWHTGFNYLNYNIYNFGRLQSVKEEFIPQDNSNPNDSIY